MAKFEIRNLVKVGRTAVKFLRDRFFTFRFFLFLVLIFWSLALNSVRVLSLQKLITGDKEISLIEVALPSPSPEVDVKSSLKIAVPKASSEVVKKSSGNPLCKDVPELWKLVADPSHEGQFIICNATTEAMTTVGELNSAQNQYRRDHNLNALSINADLCKVAAGRAKEVASNFSHDGFEAAVDGANIQRSAVGENIASGPLSGAHFVEWSWDKSPGHRENMLRDWLDGCGGVYDRFAVFIFAK